MPPTTTVTRHCVIVLRRRCSTSTLFVAKSFHVLVGYTYAHAGVKHYNIHVTDNTATGCSRYYSFNNNWLIYFSLYVKLVVVVQDDNLVKTSSSKYARKDADAGICLERCRWQPSHHRVYCDASTTSTLFGQGVSRLSRVYLCARGTETLLCTSKPPPPRDVYVIIRTDRTSQLTRVPLT